MLIREIPSMYLKTVLADDMYEYEKTNGRENVIHTSRLLLTMKEI